MLLAQANISLFRWPLEDSRMSEFAEQIEPVYRIAEQAPGFMWRFREDHAASLETGHAPAPWNDPLLLFNMSVWRDAESLEAFLRSPEHQGVMRRQSEWLQPMSGPSAARWWIPADTQPTIHDAVAAIGLQQPSHGNSERVEQMLPFIEERERSVWEAVVHKDGAALSDLFSQDYVEVTLIGKRVMRDTIVTESPQSDDIHSFGMDRIQAVILGDGVVLLSYYATIDGTFQGEPILPKGRWATSIWRCDRRQPIWKCGFFQQSPYEGAEP